MAVDSSKSEGISRRELIIAGVAIGTAASLTSAASAAQVEASSIKALTFDIYGSTTDFRGTIVREGQVINEKKRIDIDWGKFADDWHDIYQPVFDAVLNGQHPWTSCTEIRKNALYKLVQDQGIKVFDDAELDTINRVWERVEPWPDTIPALLRLKKNFVISTLSNADMSAMVDLAKNSKLPWDVILAAELAQTLKPNPPVYDMASRYLGLKPEEILMVACHKFDLRGAKSRGFRTAFVARPLELGSAGRTDVSFDPAFDFNVTSFIQLADQLGA